MMIQIIKAGLFGLLMGMSLSVAAGVDINQASAEQLAQELNGIGLVKAQEIVRYREQNGPFQSVDQLVAVKGIGATLLERNKAMLEISPPKGSTKN
ncbi:MAG: helix-hairpin-helix domain-containing protein [Halopseudomonas sp.]